MMGKPPNDRAPLVSIGIPFFNPGPFLVDAVRSVFAQTYSNWELILVDDGSQDGSLEIAQRINDPRVRVLSDGKNLGLVARLNQIAQEAKGEYLARMDADDLMHPERIARQVAFLQANPEVDLVDTGAIILHREGRLLGTRGLKPGLPSPRELLTWGGFLHASILAKRDWFLRHPYDPTYRRAEDRELFARVFMRTRFAHIPEPLYFYRFAGNVRLKAYLESYRSERKVLIKYGPEVVGYPLTLYLYVRSLVKSAVLLGLTAVGKEQLAQRRAYKPLPEDLRQEVLKVLIKIQKQPVPGW